MAGGIDHLIIAVPDPDAAATELAEGLGLAFTAGGRHPNTGTRNRIAFLGQAYLELIGVTDEAAAKDSPVSAAAVRALQAAGGLATFALVDDGLEQTVEELRANGSPISAPWHGSRVRDDGETIEWWIASTDDLAADRPPFLIRHAPTGPEWGPAALDERAAFVHPIGSPVTLIRLDVATPDPPGLAADFLRVVGLEFWAVADLAVSTVGPHTIRLRPAGEMAVPAAVVLGADVAEPRSVEALGLRFDVEPVEIAAVRQATSGTG